MPVHLALDDSPRGLKSAGVTVMINEFIDAETQKLSDIAMRLHAFGRYDFVAKQLEFFD